LRNRGLGVLEDGRDLGMLGGILPEEHYTLE
jgi:hypothetical protein